MAKRKAGVNNIIFELDNEVIELSSEDEVKEPKISCLERSNSSNLNIKDTNLEKSCSDDISVDKSCNNISSPTTVHNGGKISLDFVSIDLKSDLESNKNKDEVDSIKKPTSDLCKTTILNEDTVVDSPGNSDLGVEGCENRTPLITVRFRNKQLAVNFKQQIKTFILNLLKLHESDSLGSDNETDLELDIWPEDLHDKVPEAVEENVENSLFFVDTIPGDDKSNDVPRYRKTSSLISNISDKEPTPPPTSHGPSCFNCDGDHSLRDCPKPRDFVRIANNRKKLPARLGHYHVEDEQKFGHLIPGRISRRLRHALGLRRDELPLHIYRMRLLGYPPGWLEEARISHSGIAMFDSSGNAILEADYEEGEVIEPDSEDEFDIKKILDFPGFNVPPRPRYKEDAHLKGLPPMADHDSKLAMLQFLALNTMKAHKRKKRTMFPSVGSNNTAMEGQAEMELDSGDVPPLSDDVPPLPPPPPSCPPPPETPPPPLPSPPKNENTSDDDLKVVDFIVIDEDDGELDETETNDRASSSLIDLEAKKQLLLNGLEVTDTSALDKTDEILDETTDPPNDNTQESSGEANSFDVGAKDSENADKVIEDTAVAVNIPSDNKNVDKVLTFLESESRRFDNVPAASPSGSRGSDRSHEVFGTQRGVREDKRGTKRGPSQRPRALMAVAGSPACGYCRENGHDVGGCAKFLHQGILGRRRIALMRKWCFLCFGKHTAKVCPQQRLCTGCNGRHHPLLCLNHDDNTQESSGEANSFDVGAKDIENADKVIEDTAVAVNIPSDNKNVDKVLTFLESESRRFDNVPVASPSGSRGSDRSHEVFGTQRGVREDKRGTKRGPSQRPTALMAVAGSPACGYCRENGHDVGGCAKFLHQGILGRRKIALKRKWCFLCFGKHTANVCPQHRLCTGCNGQHHPLLCLSRVALQQEKYRVPSLYHRPFLSRRDRD